MSTLLALFNQLLIPSWDKTEKTPYLRAETIGWTREGQSGFEGEDEITRLLKSTGVAKYISEIDYEKIRLRIERDLFDGEDRIRWNDLIERSVSNARFPWLAKSALDQVKKTAIQREAWEDEGNGWINKKPAPKKSRVHIIPVGERLEDGTIELEVTAHHAGASPKIYYAETPQVTEKTGTLLSGQKLKTKKLRLYFLAIDPDKVVEPSPVEEWKGKIEIVAQPAKTQGERRFVELKALPCGNLKYTTDGSNPTIHGRTVEGPIEIDKKGTTLLAYAEADGVEGSFQRTYSAMSDDSTIDPNLPALLNFNRNRREFVGANAWKILEKSKEFNAKLVVEKINLKDGEKILMIRCSGDWEAEPAHWEEMIQMPLRYLGEKPQLVFTVNKMRFQTGQDLEAFTRTLNLSFETSEVEQEQ